MNFEDTGREFLAKALNTKQGKEKAAAGKRTAARLLAKTLVRSAMGAKKVIHSGYCAVGAGVKAYTAVKEEIELYQSELNQRKQERGE